MERAAQRRKVFLSYRSTDRTVVEEFAERLRRDGVDAWHDHWEIAPGDDIVAKMDRGIDGCAAGLIFVSRAWFEGLYAKEVLPHDLLRIRPLPSTAGPSARPPKTWSPRRSRSRSRCRLVVDSGSSVSIGS